MRQLGLWPWVKSSKTMCVSLILIIIFSFTYSFSYFLFLFYDYFFYFLLLYFYYIFIIFYYFFFVFFLFIILQTAKINALDFYSDGELLVTSSDDESIHVYNTTSGEYVFFSPIFLLPFSFPLHFLISIAVFVYLAIFRMQKVILSKKYGVDMVRFTHANNAVICASKNGWDGRHSWLIRIYFNILNRVTAIFVFIW